MSTEYLLVLLAVLFFPLVLSRDSKLGLYRDPSALIKAILLVWIPYGLWDVLATARGHWSFNPAYVLGIHILGLPVEEWLFFPVVAFVAVFTWESTCYFMRRSGR